MAGFPCGPPRGPRAICLQRPFVPSLRAHRTLAPRPRSCPAGCQAYPSFEIPLPSFLFALFAAQMPLSESCSRPPSLGLLPVWLLLLPETLGRSLWATHQVGALAAEVCLPPLPRLPAPSPDLAWSGCFPGLAAVWRRGDSPRHWWLELETEREVSGPRGL